MNVKGYNNLGADKILKDFSDLTGMDITNKSRKNEEAYTRALFYKVLMDFNCMNDRQASAYFLTLGVAIQRTSIFHAINKIDIYYKTFSEFRTIYNVYFDDKKNQSKRIAERTIKKQTELSGRIAKAQSNLFKDDLQSLVDSLPMDRRQEVYEIAKLRAKSWEWKSRDKCEIIESTDGISEITW